MAHATLISVEVVGACPKSPFLSSFSPFVSLFQRITLIISSGGMSSPWFRHCRSFLPPELETIQVIKAFSTDSGDLDTKKHLGCNAQSSSHSLTAVVTILWSIVRAAIRGRAVNNHRYNTGCILDCRTLLDPLGLCGTKDITDTDSHTPMLPMGPNRCSSSCHRSVYWIIYRIITAAPELGMLGTADPPYPVPGRIPQWAIHSGTLGCQTRWLRHAYTNFKDDKNRWYVSQ